MGFFDRVKKAFGAKPKEEKQTEQSTEEVAKSTEETAVESDATPEATKRAESETSTDQATTESHVDEPESVSSEEQDPEVTPAAEPMPESEQIVETDSQSDAVSENTKAPEPIETKLPETEKVVETKIPEPVESTPVAPVTEQTEPEEIPEPTAEVVPEVDSKHDESDQAEEIPATETEDVETTPEVVSETTEDAVAEYDQGLAKSRHGFAARLNKFLANFRSVDEDFFEDLEEMLIEADVGFETAMEISNQLRDEVKLQNAKSKKQIGQVIVEKMVDIYGEAGKDEDSSLHFTTKPDEPTIFLFVGVNGAGKTTTIGKLATKYHNEGKKVLLAAGDTFRAGAIEQLAEWARRAQVDVVTSAPGTDPASVVFDAVKKAKTEQYDILLVDTAGRLQNNVNLMNELAKIKRIIVRELPDAPQEVLLVLDASTGQNALNQAKQFSKTTDVTGLILTKLDGSSKGGIIIAIRNELHLPVKLVGLGEKAQDLQIFDAEKYVYGLFKDLIED